MLITALSFAITVIYSTAFISPANSPKWIVLSIVLPLILLVKKPEPSRALWWGFAWLVWAALTLLWATSLPDGVMRLWQFILAGAAFAIGATLTKRQIGYCLVAFCLGIWVNAVIAVLQAFGVWDFFFHATPIAGLQVNGNYLSRSLWAVRGVMPKL